MPSLDDDRRLIESVTLGIAGATHFGDLGYATQRHQERLLAIGRLQAQGLEVAALTLKANQQLRACGRGHVEAARRLASDITRLLSLICQP